MDAPIRKGETLLFLHVPKTAGTTLSRIAERHVPAGRQYRLGPRSQEAIERFNGWPAARRARYRLISGHFPYGVHEQVPGPSVYITMLREPLERVVSFHNFVRNDPAHYLRRRLSPAQCDSLECFARTTDCRAVDNGQTRQLAGDWGLVPFGGCTQAMLDRALANLRRIAVVGLTERFSASVLLFGRRLGWRHLGFRPLNRSINRPVLERIGAGAHEALLALNRYDVELYAGARRMFEEAWTASGLDDSDFHQRHPPPGAAREALFRLRSRTPREWVGALCVKSRSSHWTDGRRA